MNMANETVDKTKEVIEAAKKRREIEEANADRAAPAAPRAKDNMSPEELDALKASAEKMAEGKVQAKAHTIDGKIDIEAMGDVKGDGGDAKDYPDGDPAKALGVPVYEHGLHETKAGVETSLPPETRVSARTLAEQSRGKEVISGHKEARDKAQALNEEAEARTGRTIVTEEAEDEATIRAKAEAAAAKKTK